jgi:uncharacterized protein (TIGR02722 family)
MNSKLIRKDKALMVFICICLTILALGCGGNSVYVREDEVTKTISYNDTDLKLLAEKMVESLLQSQVCKERPKIWVSEVQNATSEYIDSQGILDKISVALMKSGKVRLVDRQALKKLAEEKERVETRTMDVADAVRLGKIVGADYVLLGNLMSIEQKKAAFFNEERLVYYKFTMRLVSMDSEIAWMEEKEIKKATDKSRF